MIEKMRSQHETLRRFAGDLLQLVSSASPCDQDALAASRWRMARMIMQNLARKERSLYRPLEQDSRAQVAIMAASFRSELNASHASYEEHLAYWTRDRIEADWSGYGRAVHHMVSFLLERLAREEAQLFPLLNPNADIGVRSVGDRNWAAGGWAIRDSIEQAA